ncbi:MAG TPA: hypothetical protein VGD64_07000 [Acidisarcina sp.]
MDHIAEPTPFQNTRMPVAATAFSGQPSNPELPRNQDSARDPEGVSNSGGQDSLAPTAVHIATQPESGLLTASHLEGPSREATANDQLNKRLLMVTSIAGAGNCAASLGMQLKMSVYVVTTRREGLAALRGSAYGAVIVDDAISGSDPQGAELLRKHAGAAVVLEVNFAISGVDRLARQLRAEMQRRQQENALAMRLACAAIACELKDTVAGLLLHSQLALAEASVSPQLSIKLHHVVQLAGNLRQRLESPRLRA